MKAIIYDTKGEILRNVEMPEELISHQVVEGQSYKIVEELVQDYFIDIETEELIKFPEKPSNYHQFNWTTKSWELIDSTHSQLKIDVKARLNEITSLKILARFPETKQRNMLARQLELTIAQSISKRPLTHDENTEFNSMLDEWNWVKQVRDSSNIATAAIDSATTAEEIETIYQNYLTDLENL